ncbi:MAG: PIG-L family deacetylase [Lacunisphaera sp.]
MQNLIVVAHPDDELLGFGATGAKLVKEGEVVQAIILCGSVDVRTNRPTDAQLYEDTLTANRRAGFADPVLGAFPNIRMNSVPHLDLVRFIEEQIVRFAPDRIFTHHAGDLNDDHLQVSRACLAAVRYFQRRDDVKAPRSVYSMEIASSTDWSFPAVSSPFAPSIYVGVEAGELETKIQSLECYRKVMRECPHPRSREGLFALATYRGGQGGYRYAEAFQLIFQRGI